MAYKARHMQDQLKPTVPETLQRLLPPCSGCLSDFIDCESLQPFPCGHFYCRDCLLKGKLTTNLYQCLHENKSCGRSELSAKITPKDLISSLISTSPPLTTVEALQPFLGLVDLRKVPCKDLCSDGVCRWGADCPYSHYPEHRNLVAKFQSVEDESCWECSGCLLIISLRLHVCPACEAPQPEYRVTALSRVIGNTSSKMEQTFQTEEDKPPGSPLGSPLRFRLDTGGDGDLMEHRSACCDLQ